MLAVLTVSHLCYSLPMTEEQPKYRAVRLPTPLAIQLQAIARDHERSLSAELRVALSEYVKRVEENDEH